MSKNTHNYVPPSVCMPPSACTKYLDISCSPKTEDGMNKADLCGAEFQSMEVEIHNAIFQNPIGWHFAKMGPGGALPYYVGSYQHLWIVSRRPLATSAAFKTAQGHQSLMEYTPHCSGCHICQLLLPNAFLGQPHVKHITVTLSRRWLRHE